MTGMEGVKSIGIAALILALASCSARETNTYQSVKEAKAARLFERGWVPDVLPDDAGPLTEAHNLDTNARCARAQFAPGALNEVTTALRATGFHDPRGRIPNVPMESCPFKVADLNRISVLFQRNGPQGDEFAALAADGRFYYWSAR